MSTVENNVTICYTKRNATQLSLWDEPAPELHHHIEAIYLSGHREIFCTASSYRPNRPGDWEWEAGFVGFPMRVEECTICNPKKSEASA